MGTMPMRKKASGQSAVELLVSAAVIVPIVLLIPTLANVLLVQTEAHKAARYVAWERVAYPQNQLKESADFARDVEDRFLRYSRSGFGGSLNGVEDSVNVLRETPWRDWGAPQSAQQTVGIIDYDSGVGMSVVTSSSATEGYINASAYLANRGGANRIQLDTLQSGQLTIGLREDSSLLANAMSAASTDPVTGQPRYFIKSSSALVVDSWVPPNDAAFHTRVSGIGGGLRSVANWYDPLTRAFRSVFQEIDEHLYVDTPGTRSAYDMVDPNQSLRLPAYVKQESD